MLEQKREFDIDIPWIKKQAQKQKQKNNKKGNKVSSGVDEKKKRKKEKKKLTPLVAWSPLVGLLL